MSELSNLITNYLIENGVSDKLLHHNAFLKELSNQIISVLKKDFFSLLNQEIKEEDYLSYIKKYISVMDGKVLICRDANEFNKDGSLLFVYGLEENNSAFMEKLEKFYLPVKYESVKRAACHYSTEKRLFDYNGIEFKIIYGRALRMFDSDDEAIYQAKKLEFLNTDEVVFNSEKKRNGFRYTLYVRRPDMITMDIYGRFLKDDLKSVDTLTHIGTGLIKSENPECLIPCAELNNGFNEFLSRIKKLEENETKVLVDDIEKLHFSFDKYDFEKKDELLKKYEKNISKIENDDAKEAITCKMIIQKVYSSKRKAKLIKEGIIDESGNLLEESGN